MKKYFNIVIAGAGGIAEAVALILAEWSEVTPTLFLGDRTHSKAKKVANWIEQGVTKSIKVNSFHLAEEGLTDEMHSIFTIANIILDCLPGSQAPRIAKFAKKYNLHYANLTEYVSETQEIIDLAEDASSGFILQTGLAPGYINLLAHGLFNAFCYDYSVQKVEKLEFKVGALTRHAVAPHYYGFTWSPVGVATEYIEDAIVIRDYKKISRPSLSERESIIIEGVAYEEDLTSGGAADLPDALEGKVRFLDYKTIRYPGHYQWINEQLTSIGNSENSIRVLQQIMEKTIPHIEDDQIILYAAVEGYDNEGMLRRREMAKRILPKKVGKHTLRAIQITTAAPLAQAAQYLLENQNKGVILQSQLNAKTFLLGSYITRVYGNSL